jgi:nitrogenase molybdenum-iron protein NifN
MKELKVLSKEKHITFIHTDTAAYKGTHTDGFMKMISAAASLAEKPLAEMQRNKAADTDKLQLNILPWMVSPADIRYLKRLLCDMGISSIFLPDYSLTLDGGKWTEYEAIPKGGTSIKEIRAMGSSDHSIQFGLISSVLSNPAKVIEDNTGVAYSVLPLPMGLKNTDNFLNRIIELSTESGKTVTLSESLNEVRGRLLDAYADVHKYFTGLTAAVYGEADFVAGMTAFLCESGIRPSICMTGEKINDESAKEIIKSIEHYGFEETLLLTDSDFSDLDRCIKQNKPDLMIGNSKGYKTSREYNIPLIRAGFPIQDRFGGQRLLHLGYEGALRMIDEIANTVISKDQAESPVGYMSM